MGGDRRVPVRPHRAPFRRLLDRHAAADGQRLAARRPRVLLHAHRRRSRASSGCAARPCSIRWGGTTTACRPSAACRTTSASAAIRRCRTTRRFSRRTSRRKQPISVSRPNFIELCARLTARRREGLRGAVALPRVCRSTGSMTYATIDRRVAAHLAARVPAALSQGPGVPARGADVVGRRLPHRGRAGRARRSRTAGCVSPHPLRPCDRAAPSRSRRRVRS